MGIYPTMGMKGLNDQDIKALRQLRSGLAAVEGLGLPALICLIAIALQEGISVTELSEQTGAPQQSTSRYVSQLLGRYQTDFAPKPFEPLVEQRISAADPRKRSLYLTDLGASLVRALVRVASGPGDQQ